MRRAGVALGLAAAGLLSPAPAAEAAPRRLGRPRHTPYFVGGEFARGPGARTPGARPASAELPDPATDPREALAASENASISRDSTPARRISWRTIATSSMGFGVRVLTRTSG